MEGLVLLTFVLAIRTRLELATPSVTEYLIFINIEYGTSSVISCSRDWNHFIKLHQTRKAHDIIVDESHLQNTDSTLSNLELPY